MCGSVGEFGAPIGKPVPIDPLWPKAVAQGGAQSVVVSANLGPPLENLSPYTPYGPRTWPKEGPKVW